MCLLSHRIPVSLGYKFAFMLLFTGVFMISDYRDFNLSHLHGEEAQGSYSDTCIHLYRDKEEVQCGF